MTTRVHVGEEKPETDEQLARRLQREEDLARREDQQRAARDAAFARALALTEQLGLNVTNPHDDGSNNTKNKNNKKKRRHNHNKKRGQMQMQQQLGNARANAPSVPQEEQDEASRRLMSCVERVLMIATPKQKQQKQQQGHRHHQHLSQTQRNHLAALAKKDEEAAEDDQDYDPDELFAALRWAFGPALTPEVEPPEHMENCQRLVVAWRRFGRDASSASAPPSALQEVEAALAELRAWAQEYEQRTQSGWSCGLPQELMEAIFQLLPADEPQHLLMTRLVCKNWCQVTEDTNQMFWRRLFIHHRRQLLPFHRIQKEEARSNRKGRDLQAAHGNPAASDHRAIDAEEDEDDSDDESDDTDEQGPITARAKVQRWRGKMTGRMKRRELKRILLKEACDKKSRGDSMEEQQCWKRRYFEELYGVDMDAWDEYKIKGQEHFLNGPRPGKVRPRYGLVKQAMLDENGGVMSRQQKDQRQRILQRQYSHARDRSSS